MNSLWTFVFATALAFAAMDSLTADEPPKSPVQPIGNSLQLTGTTELTESSGLAFSASEPHCVWTHNDSGDTARLFCFDTRTGQLTGQCTLTGATAVDWESMTSAGTEERELVVADCGDNLARREHITLHRFDEPDPHQTTRLDETSYRTLHVRFPEGPVDCEAIWYDATEASLILLAKRRLPIAAVFRIPDELWAASESNLPRDLNVDEKERKIVTAVQIATIVLPMATGADRDCVTGDVWVASYFQAFCFRRGEHATLAAQLAALPIAFEMPRLRQIEAIAIDKQSHVWVTSEGTPALLAPLAK